MGRQCADCGCFRSNRSFSSNQWRKGDGYSRCSDCVHGCSSFQCNQCQRTFNNQNELNMHMQVHRPKNVACPVCGDQRFGSGANAVQHVESGHCRGCRGQDQARDQIYRFAASKQGMKPFLNNNNPLLLLITNGNGSYGGTPDFPYGCQQCNKQFRQLSQLMQHQDQKHGNLRMLGY